MPVLRLCRINGRLQGRVRARDNPRRDARKPAPRAMSLHRQRSPSWQRRRSPYNAYLKYSRDGRDSPSTPRRHPISPWKFPSARFSPSAINRNHPPSPRFPRLSPTAKHARNTASQPYHSRRSEAIRSSKLFSESAASPPFVLLWIFVSAMMPARVSTLSLRFVAGAEEFVPVAISGAGFRDGPLDFFHDRATGRRFK